MLAKLIEMPYTTTLFSVKKARKFLPIRSVPAYLLSQEEIRYYTERYQTEDFLKDIKLTKRIYLEQGKNTDPTHYLEQGEGFLSLFLPFGTNKLSEKPLGINWIEMQEEAHERYVYIAEIENLHRNSLKGIGRASVAQAISYYRTMFPHAQENDLAVGIDPENKAPHLIELYARYGFDITIRGRMFMNWRNAMTFMNDYISRLNAVVEGRRP